MATSVVAVAALVAPILPGPSGTDPFAGAAASVCPATAGQVLGATPTTYTRTVALTFDDGPSAFTPQVLDVLAQHGVRATFFVTGQAVRADPATARRIVAEGHVIANHTWSHPQAVPGSQPYGRFDDLPLSSKRAQLDATTTEIRKATGVAPCFFRGPGGSHRSSGTAAEARARGLTISHWTVSGEDWAQGARTTSGDTDAIVRASTTSHAHPIVLLHDGKASPEKESVVSANRSNTVAALPAVIGYYKRNGYVFTDPAGRRLATGVPAPAAPTGGPGGTHVVPVEVDGTAGDEVFTQDARTGRWELLDVAAGGTTATTAEGAWSAGWTQVVAVEVDGTAGDELLVHNATTGVTVVLDLNAAGIRRTLGSARWSKGWTHLVPVEVDGTAGDELLVQNAVTGTTMALDLGVTGGVRTLGSARWSKGWTHVRALEVDGTADDELLVYNRLSGTRLLLDVGPTGGIRTLGSAPWSRG